MGDRTAIEWTDASWNPIRGVTGKWYCTKVSPGCHHCYAERLNVRFGGPAYKVGADTLRLEVGLLDQPLRWKRPRRIFVCSMTDLFHENVPDKWLDQMFAVMALAPQHQFQILTKREQRMAHYLMVSRLDALLDRIDDAAGQFDACHANLDGRWPLPNVWLGVSAEDQPRLLQRIGQLQATPAAVQFLSLEPLLGPMEIPKTWLYFRGTKQWVIVGGESGGSPERALVNRLTSSHVWNRGRVTYKPKLDALEWVRSLRDQCASAGVPFFFKQWGGPLPTSGGRELDGKVWEEYPA